MAPKAPLSGPHEFTGRVSPAQERRDFQVRMWYVVFTTRELSRQAAAISDTVKPLTG